MGRPPRQVPLSNAALFGLVFALLAALTAAAGVYGTRWGLWHFRTGFTLLRVATIGGVAAAALSAFGLFATRPGARRGAGLAALGLVVGLLTAGVIWNWARAANEVPPIHDITTDTDDPPAFDAVIPLREEATNPPEYPGAEVAAMQHEAYPDIQPIVLPVPPSVAWQRALNAANAMRWEVVAADPDRGVIEAVATTPGFGFRDDVVVRIRPAPADASRVDVRSKSRVGRSDLGMNARRIREFRERVREPGSA